MIKMPNNLFEFRNYILEDLIERGYKYIARDSTGALYAYSRKPIKKGWVWDFDIDTDGWKSETISIVSRIFTDIEWEDAEPYRIQYTKWKEVPVDTPVVYTSASGKNFVWYFCKYDEENDRVVLYKEGRTSLTEKGTVETCPENVSIYEKDKN